MSIAFWLLAALAASLPWCKQRILGVYCTWRKIPANSPSRLKSVGLVLLESLSLYSLVVAGFCVLEAQQSSLMVQGWAFWVTMLCLWLVLAFPAFAWCKLRKP
jgi:hypothetical protein